MINNIKYTLALLTLAIGGIAVSSWIQSSCTLPYTIKIHNKTDQAISVKIGTSGSFLTDYISKDLFTV
ncbi:MAG TPA: hypothetical protein VHA52_06475, partial [Candidatus Babeliaceae bacterium]|nr:hypothetical protein [Candidatus Babeliaceae bacterium]